MRFYVSSKNMLAKLSAVVGSAGEYAREASGPRKAAGLQRVGELMRVVARLADANEAVVKELLVPLLRAVQGPIIHVVTAHDRGTAEVLREVPLVPLHTLKRSHLSIHIFSMWLLLYLHQHLLLLLANSMCACLQVYDAPCILKLLAKHVRKDSCSEKDLLCIAAFISRVAYARAEGSDVTSHPCVQEIVAVATSESSTLKDHEIFKLKVLFAASETTISARQAELRSSGAAAAVAKWPGGKHDNDHIDFRKIQVLPTVSELKQASPFLPLADESDKFLIWEVSSVVVFMLPMLSLFALCCRAAPHQHVPDAGLAQPLYL
jgi:hypothetical protein